MEGLFYHIGEDGKFYQTVAQEVALHFMATRPHEMFVADKVKAGHHPLEAELLWAARQPENRG